MLPYCMLNFIYRLRIKNIKYRLEVEASFYNRMQIAQYLLDQLE